MDGVVGVRELKENLSQVLERAENGETVTVTRNGQVIAKIVPSRNAEPATWAEARAVLEAKRGPLKGFDLKKLKRVRVTGEGPSLSDLILQERRSNPF
jgi:prevent-host-death family protein